MPNVGEFFVERSGDTHGMTSFGGLAIRRALTRVNNTGYHAFPPYKTGLLRPHTRQSPAKAKCTLPPINVLDPLCLVLQVGT